MENGSGALTLTCLMEIVFCLISVIVKRLGKNGRGIFGTSGVSIVVPVIALVCFFVSWNGLPSAGTQQGTISTTAIEAASDKESESDAGGT